jgi:hypothetical protein
MFASLLPLSFPFHLRCGSHTSQLTVNTTSMQVVADVEEGIDTVLGPISAEPALLYTSERSAGM